MPSYTQYMRQMAVMDASDDDIESWITVKGNHIPIKKGQSKEDAVKEFISKKSDKEFSKRAEKPQSIGEATKKVVSQVKENREINKAAKKEYSAEFETVRKNAKANPYLYDLRYTQKSKEKAYQEYKKDTEKKAYNDKGLYQDALNELDDQIADKEKELENIHLAMTQNAEAGYFDIANSNMMDIEFVEGQLKELKKKREKLAGSSEKKEPHYFHKWTIESEKPHNLTNEQIQDKLNFYRHVRSNGRADDNELLDKIHDLSDELKRRMK